MSWRVRPKTNILLWLHTKVKTVCYYCTTVVFNSRITKTILRWRDSSRVGRQYHFTQTCTLGSETFATRIFRKFEKPRNIYIFQTSTFVNGPKKNFSRPLIFENNQIILNVYTYLKKNKNHIIRRFFLQNRKFFAKWFQ